MFHTTNTMALTQDARLGRCRAAPCEQFVACPHWWSPQSTPVPPRCPRWQSEPEDCTPCSWPETQQADAGDARHLFNLGPLCALQDKHIWTLSKELSFSEKHDLSKKAGAGGAIFPVQLWSPPFTAGPAQPNSLKRIAVLKKRFVQESKPFSKQLKQIKMKMKNQGLFLFMALTIFFSIQILLLQWQLTGPQCQKHCTVCITAG